MKICELTNVDFSLRHFLLPLMRGLRDRGHEVVGVCAEGPLLDAPRAEGFRIEAMPLARSLNPVPQARAFKALYDFFRREKFDLVHAHMPISGLLARLAAKAAGVPRVAYTCHGFLFNQPGPRWRRSLSLRMERLGGRMTDVFLTVSEEEAEDARRLGIHAGAIPVLNGRSPAVFHPDPSARAVLRAEFGVQETDCVVTVVSRLVRHKGHPELLRAMEATPNNAVLWVVGERLTSDHGESLDPHFARAEAVLGRRVKRLGYRHDIPAILAASDVFCLPSHFEGLPMSIIEAMLTGLPVVATDIRGPREQVRDGETGLLVPPMTDGPLAAALSRLAEDPALRARMGAAARAMALEKFDEAKVVGRTMDLLGA
ncbi:glycosyltransferase family 4 protein [Roseomonas terrae]|uniref:Glycosyltransferase family 4 protein n=1 Tax=Neoroseomonas terrae TaxID=424799 RepID=A0ABS5EFJ1_9PROT|nr:glycosyltransferase family 4 protein [Neoroseomonas terrae]